MTERKKPYPGDIPSAPGVYVFRDAFGEVIYVGKASNLRRRVSQYSHPSRRTRADPKSRSLINSIDGWEFHVVRSEAEALLLESRLIKEYAPHYNVLMRDDKRFLLVKINPADASPKLSLVRIRKNDGAKYYGPFPQTRALKETVEFLTRHFQLRPCRFPCPGPEERRHCMDARVKYCPEPCVGKITREEYLERVQRLAGVFEGDTGEIVQKLTDEMAVFSAKMDFEKAALRRDMIQNIAEIFGARNRTFRFASLSVDGGDDAVEDLRKALGLERPPTVIECFDVSTLGGLAAVGSRVCFSGGRPDRKNYRRFRIKTVVGIDDFAMMEEIVQRNFARKLAEGQALPDLVLVDGGKGQLAAAIRGVVKAGAPPLPVASLAKRNEELFIPGRDEPIQLDEHRPASRLVRAIRDESHRFAVAYNRELRDKRISESVLDDIPGVGETRKKALLNVFGSVAELRKTSSEEIAEEVPGIGEELARQILQHLSRPRRSSPRAKD